MTAASTSLRSRTTSAQVRLDSGVVEQLSHQSVPHVNRPCAEVPPGGLSAKVLFAVVALAPLPYGSNAPIPIAVLALALAAGLACAAPPRGRARNALLFGIFGLALAVTAMVVVQCSQTSIPDPVWSEASRLLQVPLTGTPAVVRNGPLYAAGPIGCGLAALALGIFVGADRSRAKRLIHVAAWSSLAYAVVGLINAVADPTAVLGRDRDNYLGVVLGPFINRNTAAVYFGCGAILWAALLGEWLERNDWTRMGPAAWPVLKVAGLRGAGLGGCLLAVVATGSRSGSVLTLVGLGITGLCFVRHRIERRPRPVHIAAALAVLVAGIAGVVGGSGTGQRFQSLGFSDEGRIAVYQAVLPIIRDHPWFGTGLGTFAWIYPSYRSSVPGMRNVWDKAHSTPLELASDLGLPLACVMVVAALGLFGLLVRGVLVRRRDAIIPLVGAATFGLAAAHSCVDFSLQIPGLAVVVFALAGSGLAQAFPSASRRVSFPTAGGVDEAAPS